MSAITFTRDTSVEAIYSNAPENITNATCKYTYDFYMTQNKYHDVEFYHHNSSGITDIKIAVVVRNESSETATITVDAASTRTAAGCGAADPATYKSASIYSDYVNGIGSTTISVEPGACATIGSVIVENGEYGLGKFKFKTSTPYTKCRIAYGGTGTSAADYFSAAVTQASGTTDPVTNIPGQFTGKVGYGALSATVDVYANNNFILCEHIDGTWQWPSSGKPSGFVNNNEYMRSPSYITNSKNFSAGNFGTLYNITLLNCNDKMLEIYFPTVGESFFPYNLFIYVNGAWQEVKFVSPVNSEVLVPKYIPLNSSLSQTIKVYHPAGNSSNYRFRII